MRPPALRPGAGCPRPGLSSPVPSPPPGSRSLQLPRHARGALTTAPPGSKQGPPPPYCLPLCPANGRSDTSCFSAGSDPLGGSLKGVLRPVWMGAAEESHAHLSGPLDFVGRPCAAASHPQGLWGHCLVLGEETALPAPNGGGALGECSAQGLVRRKLQGETAGASWGRGWVQAGRRPQVRKRSAPFTWAATAGGAQRGGVWPEGRMGRRGPRALGSHAAPHSALCTR